MLLLQKSIRFLVYWLFSFFHSSHYSLKYKDYLPTFSKLHYWIAYFLRNKDTFSLFQRVSHFSPFLIYLIRWRESVLDTQNKSYNGDAIYRENSKAISINKLCVLLSSWVEHMALFVAFTPMKSLPFVCEFIKIL